MTDPDRLNPLLFAGCFAYLDSDVPAGMTLPAWRSQRNGSAAASSSPPVAGAGADRAPRAPPARAAQTVDSHGRHVTCGACVLGLR